ncbi:hypothetical protein ACFQ7F_24845 [Streptomyces sp. NPDC056486]|uniref:hypothetical protein n=1 Tax=Streptomyces sp. NPDC056486 TaxID=3345835 RepID=UPI00368A2915
MPDKTLSENPTPGSQNGVERTHELSLPEVMELLSVAIGLVLSDDSGTASPYHVCAYIQIDGPCMIRSLGHFSLGKVQL